MKSKSNNGFTLIELVIVVVIIGILAALAIPRFMRATTRSKQSEAKQLLKQIYTMQHAYRQEFDSYCLNGKSLSSKNPDEFTLLGINISTSDRYTYEMVAGATIFICTATANLDDDKTIDTWVINESGALTCLADDAVK